MGLELREESNDSLETFCSPGVVVYHSKRRTSPDALPGAEHTVSFCLRTLFLSKLRKFVETKSQPCNNIAGHSEMPSAVRQNERRSICDDHVRQQPVAHSREQSPLSRDRRALQRQLAHLHSIRLFLPDHRPRSSTERTMVS